MEYLTDMVTTVPEGTSPAKVNELRAGWCSASRWARQSSHLVRLWRPPLGLGEWRSIGLFRAADEVRLRKSSTRYLFIFGWMSLLRSWVHIPMIQNLVPIKPRITHRPSGVTETKPITTNSRHQSTPSFSYDYVGTMMETQRYIVTNVKTSRWSSRDTIH